MALGRFLVMSRQSARGLRPLRIRVASMPHRATIGLSRPAIRLKPSYSVAIMRWFRANRTIGGRLALFALALQFYLAFGHIHPDDIYGPANVPLSSAAEIALPAAIAPQSLTAHASEQDNDFCAICETMFMLGASSTPEVPQLLTPAPLLRPARHFSRAVALLLAPQRTPFQSRAPPAG